jgi:hypothetical protein
VKHARLSLLVTKVLVSLPGQKSGIAIVIYIVRCKLFKPRRHFKARGKAEGVKVSEAKKRAYAPCIVLHFSFSPLLMNISLIKMKIKTKIAAQNYEVADCENLGNHLVTRQNF